MKRANAPRTVQDAAHASQVRKAVYGYGEAPCHDSGKDWYTRR